MLTTSLRRSKDLSNRIQSRVMIRDYSALLFKGINMTISYRDVLDFWFDELTPKDWFTGGEYIDALIKERFSDLHQAKHDYLQKIYINFLLQSFYYLSR